jgi:hypothetical protein
MHGYIKPRLPAASGINHYIPNLTNVPGLNGKFLLR